MHIRNLAAAQVQAAEAKDAAQEAADRLSSKLQQSNETLAATEHAAKAQSESLQKQLRALIEASEAAAEQVCPVGYTGGGAPSHFAYTQT
jgi:hypothetical protein